MLHAPSRVSVGKAANDEGCDKEPSPKIVKSQPDLERRQRRSQAYMHLLIDGPHLPVRMGYYNYYCSSIEITAAFRIRFKFHYPLISIFTEFGWQDGI